MSKTPSFSFEIFPPNNAVSNENLIKTLDELQHLTPDFISVTCSNRQANIEETTVKLAGYVQNELAIPSVAHLPGAYLTKQQVERILAKLKTQGVSRLLALRGDLYPEFPSNGEFSYASDLVEFVKQTDPSFTVLGACYPEVHPEAFDRATDIKHLKTKVDAGVDELVTQLFFDNEAFYRYQEDCAATGIHVPITAGIMPIVNRNQALRLIKTTSATLPRKFLAILEKYEDKPEALRQAGIAYAIDQIVDLATQDVAGIHLYTMNKADTAKTIAKATAFLFEKETALVHA